MRRFGTTLGLLIAALPLWAGEPTVAPLHVAEGVRSAPLAMPAPLLAPAVAAPAALPAALPAAIVPSAAVPAAMAAPTSAPAARARAAQEFDRFFDGRTSDIRGTHVVDSPTPRETHSADLPPDVASQLESASTLSPVDFRSLIDLLAAAPPRVRGPPAFDAKHTFSFELEFQVHRQITEQDLHDLFQGQDALTSAEWANWRIHHQLSPARWEAAWRLIAGRVHAALPTGWSLTSDSTGRARNTLEINTGDRDGREYHRNTERDWADLASDLARVQAVLPGGLFSVHMHLGREDLKRPDGDRQALDVDDGVFARLTKVFESHWRVLSGYGYSEPRYGMVFPLSHDALRPNAKEYYVDEHAVMLNLHHFFPTIENRIMSGLLRVDERGAEFLDPARLAADTWWYFAFLRRLDRGGVPLAALGLPTAAGDKPRQAHIAKFVDELYGDDVVGKALALSRFGRAARQARGISEKAAEEERAKARSVYEDLGLASVYELHAEAGGYDPMWESRVQEPKRWERLKKDLAMAGTSPEELSAFFPAELVVRLTAEPVRLSLLDRARVWFKNLKLPAQAAP